MPQVLGEGFRLGAFAVDEADFVEASDQRAEVGFKVVAVGVSTEAVEVDDVDPLVPGAALEGDGGAGFEEAPAQGAFRLIADQNEGAAGIVDELLEVVLDASGIAHAAGGEDDGGAGLRGQAQAELEILDVVDAVAAE